MSKLIAEQITEMVSDRENVRDLQIIARWITEELITDDRINVCDVPHDFAREVKRHIKLFNCLNGCVTTKLLELTL